MKLLAVIVSIFFPGIGSMLVGKIVIGIVQFVLWLIAGGLTGTGLLTIVGIPLAIVVWIWAMFTVITAKTRLAVVERS